MSLVFLKDNLPFIQLFMVNTFFALSKEISVAAGSFLGANFLGGQVSCSRLKVLSLVINHVSILLQDLSNLSY